MTNMTMCHLKILKSSFFYSNPTRSWYKSIQVVLYLQIHVHGNLNRYNSRTRLAT